MYGRGKKSWFLMALMLLTACDLRPRGGTGVDIPIAQVVVSPDTLTLDPQQSFQFQAFGRTDAGDSVPVSVSWATSTGAISQFGIYTADTSATDAVVTATLSQSTLSGTSRVKKRRVIQVVINPKNTTLDVGGLQQYVAYGWRNTGDSVSVSVTYVATGGSISGGGAYTAGQAPGAGDEGTHGAEPRICTRTRRGHAGPLGRDRGHGDVRQRGDFNFQYGH